MSTVASQQRPFSVAIQSTGFRELINRTLTDATKANRFIALVTSAVSVNPQLQECEPGSILSSALLGEALGLSPSPQLGQFYMVPFNQKNSPQKVAQFQIGYKGYLQLAIRSGCYKKINVLPIKVGELRGFDPMTETIVIDLIDDELERESAVTTGYYVMFEYLNGFTKAMYWSKQKMEVHADKYAQAFKLPIYRQILSGEIPASDLWRKEYSSFWYKDFDGMAMKTMLRQILSKWGILSIEMQQAFEKDMGVIDGNGNARFVDNEPQSQNENPIQTPQAETVADQPQGQISDPEAKVSEPEIEALKSRLRLKKFDIVDVCEKAGVIFYGYDKLTRDALTAINDEINK